MSAPRVLLFGYNGANNTGAEALLLADIEDARAVLGPDALLTVPTLNPANLRRYLREGPNLRIAPIPAVYFAALRRLVREHDLVLLVEGSCYMDTWTSALLWAFLWTTRCAHAMGKPCLAYAVDAGSLRPFNRWLARREASKTDLIIARSAAAAERLRAYGVTAPVEVTADNAFTFAMPAGRASSWSERVHPDPQHEGTKTPRDTKDGEDGLGQETGPSAAGGLGQETGPSAAGGLGQETGPSAGGGLGQETGPSGGSGLGQETGPFGLRGARPGHGDPEPSSCSLVSSCLRVEETTPLSPGAVGFAVVDFHLWPVVVRPWGKAEDCYRWPYYYSRSPARCRAGEALARSYAALADWVIEAHDRPVALLCMEQLDEPLARRILAVMRRPERAALFSSREHDASRMAECLRGLDALVTSRFHAAVLSLAAGVPQVAFGHDVRLEALYRDLGIAEECFVRHPSPDAFEVLRERLGRLLLEPDEARAALLRGHAEHLARARRNRELLRDFVEAHGWETAS